MNKTILIGIFLVVAACGVYTASVSSDSPTIDNPDAEWERFKRTYKRSYAKGEEDREERHKRNFLKKLSVVHGHNKDYAIRKSSFKSGVYRYAYLNRTEFFKRRTGNILPQ